MVPAALEPAGAKIECLPAMHLPLLLFSILTMNVACSNQRLLLEFLRLRVVERLPAEPEELSRTSSHGQSQGISHLTGIAIYENAVGGWKRKTDTVTNSKHKLSTFLHQLLQVGQYCSLSPSYREAVSLQLDSPSSRRYGVESSLY